MTYCILILNALPLQTTAKLLPITKTCRASLGPLLLVKLSCALCVFFSLFNICPNIHCISFLTNKKTKKQTLSQLNWFFTSSSRMTFVHSDNVRGLDVSSCPVTFKSRCDWSVPGKKKENVYVLVSIKRFPIQIINLSDGCRRLF